MTRAFTCLIQLIPHITKDDTIGFIWRNLLPELCIKDNRSLNITTLLPKLILQQKTLGKKVEQKMEEKKNLIVDQLSLYNNSTNIFNF